MGVVYSIAGHPRREVYELGKWWNSALFDDEIYRAGPWTLAEVLELCEATPENDVIVTQVHAFCAANAWDVDLVNDCEDSLFTLCEGGYHYVGSVYGCVDEERNEHSDFYLDRLKGSKLVRPEEYEALEALVMVDRRVQMERTVERLRAARNA